jgi:hypothetical protein
MPTNVKKGLRHTSSFSDLDCATPFLGSHAGQSRFSSHDLVGGVPEAGCRVA